MHATLTRAPSSPLRIVLRENVLYEIRTAADISRDELARVMRVSSSSAFKVEKGDVDPSPGFIAALMRVTGQSFESLFKIIGEDA